MTAAPTLPLARRRRLLPRAALAALVLVAVAAGSLAGLALVYSVGLPDVSALEHHHEATTADLYDIHDRLFASLALEQRAEVRYEDVPPILRQAVISAEDRSFDSGWPVSDLRLLRGILSQRSPKVRPSAPLSLQLARSLLGRSTRSASGLRFDRRVREAMLALNIQHAFTRREIFTLYANDVYLGHGIHGFEAAASYYFSKHARDLTLPEAALLASLPGTPEDDSAAANSERALRRRNAVIAAMLEEGFITAAQADAARTAPLLLHIGPPAGGVASWFVEEARQQLEGKFGQEQLHDEARIRVYTTLDTSLQQTADTAVLDGLAAYERRRGWKGHLLNVNAAGMRIDEFEHPDWHPDWSAEAGPGTYVHALVLGVLPYQVTARIGRDEVLLTQEDWAWTGFETAEQFLKRGDIVYVHLQPTQETPTMLHGELEQDSGAEGSLLAIDNVSGDVLAMVGGRDADMSRFNRATQAERQAGSSFKPYVFTAAVEAGATPEQTIEDSPVTFGGYTPRNFDGRYLGRISLLQAFADSRNVPAIRLAERVGMRKVVEVAHRLGIGEEIPAHLPVALGSVELTLQDQVAAYSVFPSDGMRAPPRLIRRVTTADGASLWLDNQPQIQAVSARTARSMMVFLKEVTRSGTAAAASALHHPVAGKTGTTLDFTNAWFIGFSPSVTCGVWVGFDSRQPLGMGETGARAALPIWMDFMKAAIAGREDEVFPGDPKAHAARAIDSSAARGAR